MAGTARLILDRHGGCGVLALCQLWRRSGFCSGTMTESCGAMRWRACWDGMVFYDRTGSRHFVYGMKKCSRWIKMKRRGKKARRPERNIQQGDRQRIWKGSEMKVRRQMSEGRPGGNARKKKKDNLTTGWRLWALRW